MNYLLAKTKNKRDKKGGFFKVISNEDFFDLPDSINNKRDYDSDYKLEDDEWFAINNFSKENYCLAFLKEPFVGGEYAQLIKNDYKDIAYLIAVQNDVYFFQKLSTSQVLKKKYFDVSDAPSLVKDKVLIVVENFAHAIYIKNTDMLYFRNLASIASIFKGIDELYKEATQEETEEFLENSFIKLDNNYSAEKVKNTNRKRIAMARETLAKFTEEEKKNVFSYVREYCTNLEFDESNENFSISNEEDLKLLLYGIEQRYYTTPIGNEKRLANSILTLH